MFKKLLGCLIAIAVIAAVLVPSAMAATIKLC